MPVDRAERLRLGSGHRIAAAGRLLLVEKRGDVVGIELRLRLLQARRRPAASAARASARRPASAESGAGAAPAGSTGTAGAGSTVAGAARAAERRLRRLRLGLRLRLGRRRRRGRRRRGLDRLRRRLLGGVRRRDLGLRRSASAAAFSSGSTSDVLSPFRRSVTSAIADELHRQRLDLRRLERPRAQGRRRGRSQEWRRDRRWRQ